MIGDWIKSVFVVDGVNDANNVGPTQLEFQLSVALFNGWKKYKIFFFRNIFEILLD